LYKYKSRGGEKQSSKQHDAIWKATPSAFIANFGRGTISSGIPEVRRSFFRRMGYGLGHSRRVSCSSHGANGRLSSPQLEMRMLRWMSQDFLVH